MNSESNTHVGRAPQHPDGQENVGGWLRNLRALTRRTKISILVMVSLTGLLLAVPAQSQTTCAVTEIWTGGAFVQDDPGVTSTVNGASTTVTVEGSATTEVCEISGIDNPGGNWTDASAPFTHSAPSGSTIGSFLVFTRPVVTSTTAPPTSVAPTTVAPTTAPPTTVPPTTAPPTTVAPTTTTTSTTIPVPRGPGNGPIAIRPEAIAQSSPDAAAHWGGDRVDVAVKGSDGFYWTFWNGSLWTDYVALGSPPSGSVGDPAIVSWTPGRLDVFVKGSTDNRLWQRFSENGGASWSDWIKPLGDEGELASSPEVSSRGPGRLDVFVRGTDGQIWQRFYDGTWNDAWIPQGQPASVGINGEPGATSWDSNRVDLFVWGSDNRLWQKAWTGAEWTGWFQPVSDGVLTSSPDATSWEPGNLLIFIRGTDGGIYALPHGGGIWGQWVRLAGGDDKINNGPGATSRGVTRFDVFGRGTDNRIYQIFQ